MAFASFLGMIALGPAQPWEGVGRGRGSGTVSVKALGSNREQVHEWSPGMERLRDSLRLLQGESGMQTEAITCASQLWFSL